MLFSKPNGSVGGIYGEKHLAVAPGLSVVIRPLALCDARDLQRNCFPTEPYAAVLDYVRRGLHFVERGQGTHLVACSNRHAVANAQLLCWHQRAEIGSLIVAERLRGRGIGTALIKALSEAAYQLGAEQIEIGADKRNMRVLDLYQRLGFVPYKEVHLPGDVGDEPIVYMVKPVPVL
jgi:ribosomal protein S18 acetylase RimI-like enzyme